MSIENHLLDLVKGVKAMTEAMMQAVEKVTEEIRREKKPEEVKEPQKKEEDVEVLAEVGELPAYAVFRFGGHKHTYQLQGKKMTVQLENGDSVVCLYAFRLDRLATYPPYRLLLPPPVQGVCIESLFAR